MKSNLHKNFSTSSLVLKFYLKLPRRKILEFQNSASGKFAAEFKFYEQRSGDTVKQLVKFLKSKFYEP
ncbi:hypothetical protein [uncultured Campylobacter sp.]|uniref:hypothetical protein n=1 Tax=uncultured Campylobacter sp. TaxID=218934 RepID=UPI00261632F0|nr:hypothetical protein [uncultured Campylobacter sp.]